MRTHNLPSGATCAAISATRSPIITAVTRALAPTGANYRASSGSGRGHAGLDRPGWGEQVDDMPRAFMRRRGPAGPPRWQRSECPAALAGCRVRGLASYAGGDRVEWREQEPAEDRPSESCTKERQPCLAVARCGFGKAMVSFHHCGEPFRACVRRGGGGRLCCLRMAKPVGRWT